MSRTLTLCNAHISSHCGLVHVDMYTKQYLAESWLPCQRQTTIGGHVVNYSAYRPLMGLVMLGNKTTQDVTLTTRIR